MEFILRGESNKKMKESPITSIRCLFKKTQLFHNWIIIPQVLCYQLGVNYPSSVCVKNKTGDANRQDVMKTIY